MSRRIILAAAALLLASSLPSGTALAQSPPPHKDPHSETRGFDAVAVLGYFGAVMALLAEREYDEKSRLLDRLGRANIPEDLRFIIDRYSELLKRWGMNWRLASGRWTGRNFPWTAETGQRLGGSWNQRVSPWAGHNAGWRTCG